MTAIEFAYRKARLDYESMYPNKDVGGVQLFKLKMNPTNGGKWFIKFYFDGDGIHITNPITEICNVTVPEKELEDFIGNDLLEKFQQRASLECKKYIEETMKSHQRNFEEERVEYYYPTKRDYNSNYLIFAFRCGSEEIEVTFWYNKDAFDDMIQRRQVRGNELTGQDPMSRAQAIQDIMDRLKVKTSCSFIIRGQIGVHKKKAV